MSGRTAKRAVALGGGMLLQVGAWADCLVIEADFTVSPMYERRRTSKAGIKGRA